MRQGDVVGLSRRSRCADTAAIAEEPGAGETPARETNTQPVDCAAQAMLIG